MKSIKLAVVSATTALALTATGVAVAEEKADAPAVAVAQNHTSDLEAAKAKLADLKSVLEQTQALLDAAKNDAKGENLQAAEAKLWKAEAELTAAKSELQTMFQEADVKHSARNEAEKRVDVHATRQRTRELGKTTEQVAKIEGDLRVVREKLAAAELNKTIAAGEKQAIEERRAKIAEYSKIIEETKSSIQEVQKELDTLSSKAEEHKVPNSEQKDQQMSGEKLGNSKIFRIIAAVLGALGLAGLAAHFIPMIMKFFNR
ncbi:hypothetical protein FRC0522_00604 [Corynebacterium diphtheriae]|nr:hypothetical protein NY055_02455 [Corynebacterium diphtheriae bv. mitis]CAB1002989.1 hypothetical protein FRC0522_00604 [Corynebacterium diphtheriae]